MFNNSCILRKIKANTNTFKSLNLYKECIGYLLTSIYALAFLLNIANTAYFCASRMELPYLTLGRMHWHVRHTPILAG